MTHLYSHNSNDNPFKDPKHADDTKSDNKQRSRAERARERGMTLPWEEPTTTPIESSSQTPDTSTSGSTPPKT